MLSPRDILVRLGRRLELLKAEPGAGVPERHRTLRAAIGWSYDLLTPEEQALFTSLAVFVGGFTLGGAEAVAGDLELDIVDGVESLLSNSLLRTERMAGGEPRFGMLETIREYALERLAERGDGEAVRRRHAGFYALLAEEAEPELRGPQQLSWLEHLDAELANIRAALTWATESGDAEAGLRIGAGLWRLLAHAGVPPEGRERLERLLALGCGSSAARASAQGAVAAIAIVQGDHEAVRRLLEASLPVHRRRGRRSRVASRFPFWAPPLGARVTPTGRSPHRGGLDVARRSHDPSTEAMLLFQRRYWRLRGRGARRGRECDRGERARGASGTGTSHSVGNWLRALGSTSLARHDYEGGGLVSRRALPSGASSASRGASPTRSRTSRSWPRRRTTTTRPAGYLRRASRLSGKAGERLGLAANLEVYGRLADAQVSRPRRAPVRVCERPPGGGGCRRVRALLARPRAGRHPAP